MRVAVLDVGSNTARVLVADISVGGGVTAVEEKRERLGLGAEIARTGTLSRDAVRTVARACRGYAKVGRALGAERAQVIVTAPGRQGRAPGLLVSALAEATQLQLLRPVGGRGVGPRLRGGGRASTCAAGRRRRSGGAWAAARRRSSSATREGGATWVGSVDLGSIRLTRQHLHGDPPSRRELRRARDAVRASMAALSPSRPDRALATGGSARAMAKLVGRVFDADDVEEAIAIFARRPSAKVAREAGIHPVRAASVLGGALLLAETARLLERPLGLARGGVREGAALALAGAQVSAAA